MDRRERAETFTRYVGLELKGKIIARGYTANAVATAIGRSPAAFNRWLNGKAEIPVSVLCEACEYIDIDPTPVVDDAYSRMAVESGERGGFEYPEADRVVPPAADEFAGEDFDVTHEDLTQRDVALVARAGRRRRDSAPHAE